MIGQNKVRITHDGQNCKVELYHDERGWEDWTSHFTGVEIGPIRQGTSLVVNLRANTPLIDITGENITYRFEGGVTAGFGDGDDSEPEYVKELLTHVQ